MLTRRCSDTRGERMLYNLIHETLVHPKQDISITSAPRDETMGSHIALKIGATPTPRKVPTA